MRGEEYQVCFQVVDGNYVPLLGRETCEKMHVIHRINAIKDNIILDEFPEVFQGLGCLSGKYHININPLVPPVVHPPRRVPHSKREPVKKELTLHEKMDFHRRQRLGKTVVNVTFAENCTHLCLSKYYLRARFAHLVNARKCHICI